MLRKLNLQLFAGEEEESEGLYTEDEVEVHEEDSSSDTEAETEDTAEDTSEETEEETEDKNQKEDTEEPEDTEETKDEKYNDSVPWIKKRLARARRSFEKEFISQVTEASEGVPVSKDEIPSAVRLWNLLKHNSALNSEVTKAIDNAFRNKSVKSLREISGSTKDTVRESQLELKEERLNLREHDTVFKKYEAEILEWAEDEGLPLEKATDLKRVYREWKGENAQRLMVKAEGAALQKAKANTAKKQEARVQTHRNAPVSKPRPIDYQKSSDSEILKHEKLSLFIED